MLKSARLRPAGKLALATALAATTIGALAATPAMADPWRGGYRHYRGGGDAGAAIAGGIVGLAVGAAIASSDHTRVYYEEPYYGPAYYPAPVYYEAPGYYYGAPYPRYYAYPRHYWHGYPGYYHRGWGGRWHGYRR